MSEIISWVRVYEKFNQTQGYIAAFPLHSEASNDWENFGFCCPPEMYPLKFNHLFTQEIILFQFQIHRCDLFVAEVRFCINSIVKAIKIGVFRQNDQENVNVEKK
jgi:hypothetical protein